ncbi:dicarboxylate/amino acid:cation symporter [Kovacikia minuta CCNUW1]|uniref:dicarboxylate/amino acid:cation symporter n=1 Tax=Kovacikia minuta TaxID=2931930 RepID=UPI001CCEA6E9|nr:dicarboxylate/amino acid:cation symporter [Kovacikia minuta]UBF28120.1 dicarboxylate/amino acid:cation symporter [Kovacikia minuta CCNUW1]
MTEHRHNIPWWERVPLYVQIVIALILAIALGIFLGAGQPSPEHALFAKDLAIPCTLVLKALRALATPLILLAVLHSFLTTSIPGRSGRRLIFLLLTNTLAAILIGLLVANILQPGTWGQIGAPPGGENAVTKQFDPWGLLQDSVPEAIFKPLVDNNVIQLIVVALSFGIVLRALKSEQVAQGRTDYLPVEQMITIFFEAVIRVLKWVIILVPLAVFGIVAKTIALEGFTPFRSLGAFVVAVLLALFLQACYYLVRVSFGSWVSPIQFLAGGSDAFLTAFSTASSTATMPVTFRALLDKIGLRESSASLGALVGSNFNNDGTALYEAMSALFVAQVLGLHLSLDKQLIVVLTSIFASVGAAGIPEAGLVTMTLVFTAVGLPTQYIAILITVDWFLDRCRTAINVMGDMTVSCLLDGKQPKLEMEPALEEALHPESD